MNLRETAFGWCARLQRYPVPEILRSLGTDWPARAGAPADTGPLRRLLQHSMRQVPYYEYYLGRSNLEHADSGELIAALKAMPVLTKEIIRQNFERLKSADLGSRRWYYNTSGGSTGEPVKLVQDDTFRAWCSASSRFACQCMGCEYGDRKVLVWGSERDILQGTVGLKAKLSRWLENCQVLNAFRMTPQDMRRFLQVMDQRPARLIVAYAQALYELARFAEAENIKIRPQFAATTSAGTLYPHMRETIQRVFHCPVYNWYGSREVGLIGTELPGREGLWVPPWGQYVEIIDESGRECCPGQVGSILVTCLTNYAMPLIRYQIGDRGAFACMRDGQQVLQTVCGREVDAFRRPDGTLIDGEYFTHLVYFRPWVQKFQFVQTSHESVVLSVVLPEGSPPPPQTELDTLSNGVRKVLGQGAKIQFNWVKDIPPSPSGKYRYTISNCAT